MTPIQKAKEIIKSFVDKSYRPGWGKFEDERFDKWAQTPQAAALLSGEDWKEDGGLLRECAMRCHLAFPETEQDLKWFDEGLKHQDRFHLALGKALDLGNMELQQVQYDEGVKEQEQSLKAIDNLPKPDFDKMINRILKPNPLDDGDGRVRFGEWQLCPKCQGFKQIPNPFSGTVTGPITIPCDICGGSGKLAKPIIK